ncbi:putative 4-hydroxy-4-methyl-2-oxoglutarate aldolase [Photobacterium aphoticum]|uniref:4-hydroxy-4-methyl-2-oxoglutarate aldolase n=1 Tax=Photobacterium aphoticum TaxID=754436 RepID=A0A0J1GMY0_9GAMM|nr:putative 4-hydroxy-4-methyl-2-oxoglutarate aldolase [Photobacterium aphoticum]KLV00794.1 ribonuclease activity regulator protein RraA [Photobacterium aphoticum]PSU54990.1 putative 4-hydroxy-4-methyl-2-oxoglutarate aldolase [Photobacterium aphoticum]GHA51198.1 putative 4-hydroxy-4-methyl-2-oxoglutarate aldolase [Photobacterium aphoticum]
MDKRIELKDLTPDLCDHYEEDVRWLPLSLHSFGGRDVFFGETVTLRCFEDNSLVRDIVSRPGKGKVLFIDGHGSSTKALLGDQLALLAQKNGWEGIVVHGVVRDVGTLATLDLGVQAMGTSPIKTVKRQTGEENVTLTVVETLIYPGDMLYADRNGVIFSQKPLDLSVLS